MIDRQRHSGVHYAMPDLREVPLPWGTDRESPFCFSARRVVGWALFLALGLLPIAELSAATLAAGEAAAMLATHNRWRAEVDVPPLAWSAELAETASRWAEGLKSRLNCGMEHSRSGLLGENLYWASPWRYSDGRRAMQEFPAGQPADRWGAEKADYDAVGNHCRPGRQCGHYTQMVWRDTREVGCGRAVCGDASQVWVCNYRPAGNFIGRRPY